MNLEQEIITEPRLLPTKSFAFLALVFLRSWLKLTLVDFVVTSNPMLDFAAIM